MDLTAVERTLRNAIPGAILVDPRFVRRVIKRHRRLPGLGLHVPHGRCYALRREALASCVDPGELGLAVSLPDEVVLVARPSPDEILGATKGEVLGQLWRAAFHGLVHLAIEAKMARGELAEPALRERIDRIGQTEFDEIRAVLRHDDLLLPPQGDREAYAEFAALYLELRHFAPALVLRMFPALGDLARIDAILAPDVDAGGLLARSRPEGAVEGGPGRLARKETSGPTFSALPSIELRLLPRRPPDRAAAARLLARAASARAGGRLVRAGLLATRAAAGLPAAEEAKARALARADFEALSARFSAAIRPRGDGGARPASGDLPPSSFTPFMIMLADAAETRGGLRYPIEARLLHDLEHACVAAERPLYTVDLVTWAASLGRRPVVRSLPAAREVQVVRHVRAAHRKLRHVALGSGDRKLLAKLLGKARDRAELSVRAALGPAIAAVLDEVGLRPHDVPERVARKKLVEELLDQVVAHGFFSIGHLRDAVSRNQLKLTDLDGAGELWRGDALLEADRRLAASLDGVYRRGEVYLRGLQKASSVGFGTAVGRFIVLYLVLPALSAFVLLEGVSHLVGPLAGWLGLPQPHLVSAESFGVTTAVIFALLHSERARFVARRLGRALGWVLRLLLWRGPAWVFSLPPVRRVLESRAARMVARLGLAPVAVAGVLDLVTPLHDLDPVPRVAAAIAVTALSSVALGARVVVQLLDVAVDWTGRNWRTFSRRVLPGLLALVVGTFKLLTDLLARAIYEVDEWLRFRDRGHPVTLAGKAVLGVVWTIVASVIRLYTLLLIEPEVNPLKHFPVVTVAHKMMLPFSPTILAAIERPLEPLGPLIANTIAAPTVFLLPGVFGFLVWELKENWRLYRRTRPRSLEAAPIGPHGEDMDALLRPGLHSGTVPKLYAKLRRDARKASGDQGSLTRVGVLGEQRGPSSGERALAKHQEELGALERAVRSFFDRELSGLLAEAARWRHGAIEVTKVELVSNRVRVTLACPNVSPAPATLSFEEQSGLIVAGVAEPGFVGALGAGLDAEERVLFENALAGLYHLVGVDLVREVIEASLDGGAPYDIADEGLVVWPGEGYRTEIVYPLRDRHDVALLVPRVRGEAIAAVPRPLDAAVVVFARQRVAWADWVAAWRPPDEGAGAPLRRLVRGPSLLPPLSADRGRLAS